MKSFEYRLGHVIIVISKISVIFQIVLNTHIISKYVAVLGR